MLRLDATRTRNVTNAPEFCPNFTSPPTVETVLGVQFEPLRGFRSHHYGMFWKAHLSERGYSHVSDESLLPTYLEEFGASALRLTKRAPTEEATGVRMKARTSDRMKTVQLQPDKLYLSWARNKGESPRYAATKPELLRLVDELTAFAGATGLGEFAPNLWEVNYVNQVPMGDLWSKPSDWYRVLPTLFPATDPSIPGVEFATYSGEWHFEIQPQMGRVHVRVAKMVMNQSETPTLYLSLVARGRIGEKGSKDVQSGLDLGHDACVRLFFALTSEAAHKQWGYQP